MARNLIKAARGAMARAFAADPAFRQGYIDNIAMRLYDCQNSHTGLLNFDSLEVRNQVADQILHLIFETE